MEERDWMSYQITLFLQIVVVGVYLSTIIIWSKGHRMNGDRLVLWRKEDPRPVVCFRPVVCPGSTSLGSSSSALDLSKSTNTKCNTGKIQTQIRLTMRICGGRTNEWIDRTEVNMKQQGEACFHFHLNITHKSVRKTIWILQGQLFYKTSWAEDNL